MQSSSVMVSKENIRLFRPKFSLKNKLKNSVKIIDNNDFQHRKKRRFYQNLSIKIHLILSLKSKHNSKNFTPKFDRFFHYFLPVFKEFSPTFCPFFTPDLPLIFHRFSPKKFAFLQLISPSFSNGITFSYTYHSPFLQRLTFPLYSFFPHLLLSIFPLQSLFFHPISTTFHALFSPNKPLSYTPIFPCFVVISTKKIFSYCSP